MKPGASPELQESAARAPTQPDALAALLREVRACHLCEAQLPLGPRPVLRADVRARVLIVGQAPGTRVHATGIPWNDPSGDRLRDWLQVDRETFYDERRFAIIPAGLCYPGRGRSGDLPPRPECAPLWHPRLRALLPRIELTLLVGQYAQAYYLGSRRNATLTETVHAWREYGPDFLPLPHPSPRNTRWLQVNPWFAREVLPRLRERVQLLSS
jgi:uracil-DNA glycosylase